MNVLIIGSAPNAIEARSLDLSFFNKIVTINNAWKITPFWTHSIFPEDFPKEKRPTPGEKQSIHSSQDYVSKQNYYGGFVYAGGTMAFTAAYWSLYTFSPSLIVYLGCDMIYSGSKTHFYGRGEPDPLRRDKTLKNLPAKSARFECFASKQSCAVINLSNLKNSQLVHRKTSFNTLLSTTFAPKIINEIKYNDALNLEKSAGYFINDGKYWKEMKSFNEEKIAEIDSLWIEALK